MTRLRQTPKASASVEAARAMYLVGEFSDRTTNQAFYNLFSTAATSKSANVNAQGGYYGNALQAASQEVMRR